MDEFDRIATYLSPLADAMSGTDHLTNDAAILDLPKDKQLVITKDCLIEGTHFIGNEPPDYLAQKLLRVNLSDLAAMGAKPYGYLLGLMLPSTSSDEWVEIFAKGLKQDQKQFGFHLIGGDTIAGNSQYCFSLTAMGLISEGKTLKRHTAQEGDIIFVSGTLGDAALGLQCLSHDFVPDLPSESREYLITRYHIPEPRIALGQRLPDLATAAMDVSDGLLQDLGHICLNSGLGATLEATEIPLSSSALSTELPKYKMLEYALTRGDDYELLFTANESKVNKILALGDVLNLHITPIGCMEAKQGIRVLDATGDELRFDRSGYQHF
jgi:thiamine-monophosphate kinase